MGYDMSLEQIPAGLEAAVKAYNDHIDKIYAIPFGSEAKKLWETAPRNPTYFSLNIFSMSKYCDFMLKLNMIAYRYPRIDYKNFNETTVEAPLGGEEPGIPIDKLSSNDHWLVRPEECASALKAYEQFTRQEVLSVVGEDSIEYWDKWIDFLRAAAENGGFRVD